MTLLLIPWSPAFSGIGDMYECKETSNYQVLVNGRVNIHTNTNFWRKFRMTWLEKSVIIKVHPDEKGDLGNEPQLNFHEGTYTFDSRYTFYSSKGDSFSSCANALPDCQLKLRFSEYLGKLIFTALYPEDLSTQIVLSECKKI